MQKEQIKLTMFSSGAGWASKIGAKDLAQVLSKLNFKNNKNSSGFESFDDCCVYPISKGKSIIQTVDFFTPIVNNPFTFGQIAATNALSDIYAMGGEPLFALNIVAFPTDKLNLDILSEILDGGLDICQSINIPILGGHSIKDDVPKYGLCVTGIIENEKILKNNTAQCGDVIILTKPIGSGIITTALKKEIISSKDAAEAILCMKTLNNIAQSTFKNFNITSCTDITGYGLLGHLNEMCSASSVSAQINFNQIPLMENVLTLAKKNIIPGGTKKNFNYVKNNVKFSASIDEVQKIILADAQTSGGLLFSCKEEDSKEVLKNINKESHFKSKIIGHFIKPQDKNIICDWCQKFT